MNHWGANLGALAVHNPGAAARLGTLGPVDDQGVWTPARSGVPSVQLDGIQLVSAFDPVAEARKAVPDWDEIPDFLVLPGLGAGYLAEAAAVRYPDLPVVIVEEDPRWAAEVVAHRDLTFLFQSPFVILLLGPDPGILGAFLGNLSCRTVETLPWRPLAVRSRGWQGAVADQVAQAQARSRVNLATYQRFADLWRRNLHKNEQSARDVRPLKDLAGHWAGCPCVIAAAGPSLAGSFGWMELHRDRYVLIAVDTAWPSLAARGVEPDVLLILDGQYWNSRHVDQKPPARTLVVTEWTGPPRAFRLAPGRTFVAATSLPFLKSREEALWGTLGTLASGGSVATAAWSLALVLGCTDVAFAGLDLGFPRGQTHVPGSQFEEGHHQKARRFQPAETLGLGLRGLDGLAWRPAVDGGRVLSDPRMDLFRAWISRAVQGRPDVRAVNLGTSGSLVPGLGGPTVDYGSSWPPLAPREPPASAPLVRSVVGPGDPSTDPVRRLLGAPDLGPVLTSVTQACDRLFGPGVWGWWAGRALETWARFPSPRSREAVEELARAALTWELFWEKN